MEARKYISLSFESIAEFYSENKNNISILNDIYDELKIRKKNKRIPMLLEKVLASIEENESKNLAIDVDEGVKIDLLWDTEQRTVIEFEENDSKIVEAGPGTGKTAIACARVVHLVEECGLEANKILLLSFTRTAVKEIRDRIELFATDAINVSGLQICTLDSFTWQILRGLGNDQSADLMTSYDANIDGFMQQLKNDDSQLLDYLEEFEHVILDEGQDLVGERAELVIQLIDKLEDECGVTIFSDSAQAIYGFTDDTETHCERHSLTVVERILQGEIDNFERINLTRVHRTQDENLIKLFQLGRQRLLDKKESDLNGWLDMKQLIKDCSHGSVKNIKNQNLNKRSDCLVLFRTRAEVLMASAFLWADDTAHKLRMSGTPARIHPWIGRLFGELQENFLNKEQFNTLWLDRIANTRCEFNVDEAWSLLIKHVGDSSQRIKMTRLRELLARDRPHLDFVVDDDQLEGATLGTIHASKGREASQVNFMLPPDNYLNDDETSKYRSTPREIAEEERVLFVGATRARQCLKVGSGTRMFASRLENKRTYKRTKKIKNSRMVEVGLSGDVDQVSMADGRLSEDPYELQQWLWGNSTKNIEMELIYNSKFKRNVLVALEEKKNIGILSKNFYRDIWKLNSLVEEKENLTNLTPNIRIKNIRMVGVTTVVIPEEKRADLAIPWRHSGFLLVPVICGFPMVYFNERNEKKNA
jgi:hypothetical protein